MFYRKHPRVTAPHSDELVTKQEMKDECDINNILKLYQQTGIFAHINTQSASYQDLPDQHDYQDALNTVMRGEAAFDTLPSVVRDHYGNDPARFLAALTDPSEKTRLTEWGVFKAPEPEPTRATQAPPEPNPRQQSARTPGGSQGRPEPAAGDNQQSA